MVEVFLGVVTVIADRRQQGSTIALRSCQLVPIAHEPFERLPLLGGARREGLGRALLGRLDLSQRPPRLRESHGRRRYLGGDLLIATRDLVEVVELGDQIVQAPDLEEDLDLVGRVVDVDLDDPPLEALLRDPLRAFERA